MCSSDLLAYLGASVLHARWYRDDPNFLTPTVLETVVFVAVAWVLRRIPATLITRIRQARGVIGEAEQGYLAVRAAAAESDELGFLEKSFNRMLDEIGRTISLVQREADEVAAFAEELAASSEQIHATSETVTQTTQRLATDLGQQRSMADGARGESAKAADQAESLRVRACNSTCPDDRYPRRLRERFIDPDGILKIDDGENIFETRARNIRQPGLDAGRNEKPIVGELLTFAGIRPCGRHALA